MIEGIEKVYCPGGGSDGDYLGAFQVSQKVG